MVRKSNDGSIDGAERVRRRAETRRLEILRAAGRVFRRRGYAASGMREIAAEAGLSPGNLYHYFGGKDEILCFCQDRALDRLLASLETARLASGPVAEQLRELIEAHVRCLLDDVEGSAAHLEVEGLPEPLRRQVVAKRDRYERGLRRLVAEGVRRGELDAGDPTLATRAMLGAINWTARWFRPEGPRRASAVGVELADYLVRGLGAAPAASRRRRAAGGGGRK